MKTSTKHQQSLMMAYSVKRLSTADLITHHKGIQLALTNLSQVNTHTRYTRFLETGYNQICQVGLYHVLAHSYRGIEVQKAQD